MKKLMYIFFVIFLTFSLSTLAQDDQTEQPQTDQTQTDQTQTETQDEQNQEQMETGEQDINSQSADPSISNQNQIGMNQDQIQSKTLEELDAELAKLSEKPTDEIKMNLESVAEKHARHLQTQFNLDEDGYNDVKECLTGFLNDTWEARIALAKESNDFDAVQEYDAEIAELRVDLVESIKDEIPEEQANMWRNQAVNFWLSLDTDFHAAKQQSVGFATIAPVEFDADIQTGEGSIQQSDEADTEGDTEN